MDNNKKITVLRWVALVPILAITHFAILQVPKLFSGVYSNGNLFIVPDTTLGIFLMLVISVFSIFEVWAFIKVGTLVAPKKKSKFKKSHLQLYSLCAIPVLLVFLFSYIPLYGLLICFKNYNYRQGIRDQVTGQDSERRSTHNLGSHNEFLLF